MKPVMTEQEIADELGLTQQGVNWLLQSGMRKFRERWELLHGPFELPHITDEEMFAGVVRQWRREEAKK